MSPAPAFTEEQSTSWSRRHACRHTQARCARWTAPSTLAVAFAIRCIHIRRRGRRGRRGIPVPGDDGVGIGLTPAHVGQQRELGRHTLARRRGRRVARLLLFDRALAARTHRAHALHGRHHSPEFRQTSRTAVVRRRADHGRRGDVAREHGVAAGPWIDAKRRELHRHGAPTPRAAAATAIEAAPPARSRHSTTSCPGTNTGVPGTHICSPSMTPPSSRTSITASAPAVKSSSTAIRATV